MLPQRLMVCIIDRGLLNTICFLMAWLLVKNGYNILLLVNKVALCEIHHMVRPECWTNPCKKGISLVKTIMEWEEEPTSEVEELSCDDACSKYLSLMNLSKFYTRLSYWTGVTLHHTDRSETTMNRRSLSILKQWLGDETGTSIKYKCCLVKVSWILVFCFWGSKISCVNTR